MSYPPAVVRTVPTRFTVLPNNPHTTGPTTNLDGSIGFPNTITWITNAPLPFSDTLSNSAAIGFVFAYTNSGGGYRALWIADPNNVNGLDLYPGDHNQLVFVESPFTRNWTTALPANQYIDFLCTVDRSRISQTNDYNVTFTNGIVCISNAPGAFPYALKQWGEPTFSEGAVISLYEIWVWTNFLSVSNAMDWHMRMTNAYHYTP